MTETTRDTQEFRWVMPLGSQPDPTAVQCPPGTDIDVIAEEDGAYLESDPVGRAGLALCARFSEGVVDITIGRGDETYAVLVDLLRKEAYVVVDVEPTPEEKERAAELAHEARDVAELEQERHDHAAAERFAIAEGPRELDHERFNELP